MAAEPKHNVASFSGEPAAPHIQTEPFTFSAITSNYLLRNELITFYVDATGKITADKLEFIGDATLRLSKRVLGV